MPKDNLNELQNLPFDGLTLSPTKANWVEKWSKAGIISFIKSTMWVLFTKDEKTQLGVHAMIFRNVR